ncbi:Rhodanese-like domain containing protein [Novymonas esmeraldas]|uniref:Rhodanese-like domain containing protein n=1 Tax=Novymonas esmeraldas TaxID=1808958 RepID=A0AAW0ET01_9TRYP
MSINPAIGDKDVLQRRTAVNPKYNGVQAVVESGMTTQLAQYMRDNTVKTKKQPGELFQRLRTDTVAAFLDSQEPKSTLADGGFARPMDEYGGAANAEGKPMASYLLLDCRDVAHYETCHIKSALHYPKIKLLHATSPFLPEMYSYKNKENKCIVLYDLEEEAVVPLANTMFQKGIDNVAILAGGLREFAQDYATFLTAPSPVPIVPRDTRLKRRADEVTQARSEARTTTSHKPKSLSSSLARTTRKGTF